MYDANTDHVIKVDTAELRAIATSIRTCGQFMQDEQAQLNTMNQVLLESWSGQARNAHERAFALWQSNFQKKIVAAQMIAAGFTKVADDFVATSERVQAIWSGKEVV